MVGRPIDQHAAEHRRQPTAQRHSDRIDRDRDPQPARRKSIGDRRIGTGRQRRLPPPPPPPPPPPHNLTSRGRPPPEENTPHTPPPHTTHSLASFFSKKKKTKTIQHTTAPFSSTH